MATRGTTRFFRGIDCTCRALPRRTFASSATFQKHGAVPVFRQTSSTELDDTLANLRRKVFLPAHLSKEHQDLIYSGNPQQIRSLQSDPVTVEISGEEFRLEHIDRLKDLPNRLKTLWKSMDLMKEKKDWDNLQTILQGLQTAGWKMTERVQIQILKKAAKAERQDIVLELVRRASDTNFRLNSSDVLRTWVDTLQLKAMDSGWDEKQTRQALSWLEMTVDLTKEEKHAMALKGDSEQKVYVTLLQLSAVRAARHLKEKDEEGKVAAYAEKVLGRSINVKPVAGETTHDKNGRLKTVVTLWHGIEEAQKVLGPSSKLAKRLNDKIPELESESATIRQYLSENPSKGVGEWRGLQYYNALIASKA